MDRGGIPEHELNPFGHGSTFYVPASAKFDVVRAGVLNISHVCIRNGNLSIKVGELVSGKNNETSAFVMMVTHSICDRSQTRGAWSELGSDAEVRT